MPRTIKYFDEEDGRTLEIPWDSDKDPTDDDIAKIKNLQDSKALIDTHEVNAKSPSTLSKATGLSAAPLSFPERALEAAKVFGRSAMSATIGDPVKAGAGKDPGGIVSMLMHPLDSLKGMADAENDTPKTGDGILDAGISSAMHLMPGSTSAYNQLKHVFGDENVGGSDPGPGVGRYLRDEDAALANGDNSIVDKLLRGSGNITGQILMGKMLEGAHEDPSIGMREAPATRSDIRNMMPAIDENFAERRVQPRTVDEYLKADEELAPEKVNAPQYDITQLEGEKTGNDYNPYPPEQYNEVMGIGKDSGFTQTPIDLTAEAPMSFGEKLRGMMLGQDVGSLIESTPESQRGAIGDSGALNAFENSQAKKYGSTWRESQTPEEAAFHQKLLSGAKDVSFDQVKPGVSSDSLIENGKVNQGALQKMIEDAKRRTGNLGRREADAGAIADNLKMPEAEPVQPDVQPEIQLDPNEPVDVTDSIRIPKSRKAMMADFSGEEPIDISNQLPEPAPPVIEGLDPAVDVTDSIKVRKKPIWADQSGEAPVDVTDQLPTKKDPFERVSNPKSEKSLISDLADLPKTLRSSLDISNPGRQGLFLLNRPTALKAMLRGGKSAIEKFHLNVQEDLASRPNAENYKKFGLEQVDYDPTGNPGGKDEFFPSQLAEKIPGVKQSERMFIDQGNLARADMFDMWHEKFSKLGKTPETNPELYHGMGKYLSTLTGRTKLPASLQGASTVLNRLMWSPRFLASRVQLLNPKFYYDLPPEMRLAALRDVGGTVAVGTTMLAGTAALLKAAGHDASVELDPRHSDFGKLRVGTASYDFSAGLVPVIRTISRLSTGIMKTRSGTYRYPGRNEDSGIPETKFKKTMADEALNFAGNKLAPAITVPYNLLQGKGYMGEKYGAGEALRDTLEPMSISETRQAAQNYGGEEALKTLPGFLGVGVQEEMPESEKVSSSGSGKSKKHKKKFSW